MLRAPQNQPTGGPLAGLTAHEIWVSKAGTIELDGEPTDLPVVESTLAALAKQKGVVLYGRDAASEEPHPNGMKVIQLVVPNRLPTRTSAKLNLSPTPSDPTVS